MTGDEGGLVPVDTGLVLQTLVEKVFAHVQERRSEPLGGPIGAVLRTEEQRLAADNDPALEDGLRHAGYLARVVEVELFEPAQSSADWIEGALREHTAGGGGWAAAITRLCGDIARSEPLGRPRPDDELAMSWRVPGPGGHVRHYLARRTIEEDLRELTEPVVGDPAELKRPWLYGFFVRACEEVLPAAAVLDQPPA